MYDIGIFGLWYGRNYGSIITYFALKTVVEKMGYSTVMITNPLGRESVDNDALPESHPLRFAKNRYQVTPRYRLGDMYKLNNLCRNFLLGSDQLWNYGLSKRYKDAYFFDFVEEGHRMIAYGTSFGKFPYNGPTTYKPVIREHLSRFTGISVRDDFSLRILREELGLDGVQVLDPVFLCPKSAYDGLIGELPAFPYKDYIFAYILDPTPEIGQSLQRVIESSGKQMIVVFDEGSSEVEMLEHLGIKDERLTVLKDPSVKMWLACFKNADFVLTDSFHGMCFSMIFERQFVALKNKLRGAGRFDCLLSTMGLLDRMVETPEAISQAFAAGNMTNIDYEAVNAIIEKERIRSMEWLQDNLRKEIKPVSKMALASRRLMKKIQRIKEEPVDKLLLKKLADVSKASRLIPSKASGTKTMSEADKLKSHPEFIKIRLLATLLRDYGVKHVVLSPGGRDVPLVRMFEYNDDQFILHRVTDERSAAYFGLGLAAQIHSPVACVCTSGTAASNYLPAVTEAYYTRIPLIMITADRKSVYHEQGEDQTIPQNDIYHGVIKKSVTLPEEGGNRAEYQARRDIADCILETTHGVCGPVHINIAIDNPSLGAKVPKSHWKLLPRIRQHLLRVGVCDGEDQLMRWVTALKEAKRVLIVYGQNVPATELQLKNIEAFTKKYNCVVLTDPISNLKCSYSLSAYNMLKALSQKEFNEELTPDIIISVGGKRLMNDPLTFKIRHGASSIRHWDVAPDGKIRDFYFRQTSILEMSQDVFFSWFAAHAGFSRNDGKYYEVWKKMIELTPAPNITEFNSQYVQSHFLPAIPKNSFLHLGVGESFYTCRRFEIDSSVEVYCNMGTNGIDGCTSTFMGQCAVIDDRLCFLLVGDLSFFYDLNSIWNKELKKNMRILLVNNNGTGLLRNHGLKGISSEHNTVARGWVESVGFTYMSAKTKAEFDTLLPKFLSDKSNEPIFFEVLCK